MSFEKAKKPHILKRTRGFLQKRKKGKEKKEKKKRKRKKGKELNI